MGFTNQGFVTPESTYTQCIDIYLQTFILKNRQYHLLSKILFFIISEGACVVYYSPSANALLEGYRVLTVPFIEVQYTANLIYDLTAATAAAAAAAIASSTVTNQLIMN